MAGAALARILDALWPPDLPARMSVFAMIDGARDERIHAAVRGYVTAEGLSLFRRPSVATPGDCPLSRTTGARRSLHTVSHRYRMGQQLGLVPAHRNRHQTIAAAPARVPPRARRIRKALDLPLLRPASPPRLPPDLLARRTRYILRARHCLHDRERIPGRDSGIPKRTWHTRIGREIGSVRCVTACRPAWLLVPGGFAG